MKWRFQLKAAFMDTALQLILGSECECESEFLDLKLKVQIVCVQSQQGTGYHGTKLKTLFVRLRFITLGVY